MYVFHNFIGCDKLSHTSPFWPSGPLSYPVSGFVRGYFSDRICHRFWVAFRRVTIGLHYDVDFHKIFLENFTLMI